MSGIKVQSEKIIEMFDTMADSYDNQWAKMAAINSSLHLQMSGILAPLPEDAHILCVGAGTGAEILYLADKHPGWKFTAVEPSARMLDVCRQLLKEAKMESRCTFHCGYLESLTTDTQFDAATAILVSQFILDTNARTNFFSQIAATLKSNGILISVDLSASLGSQQYESLLNTWVGMMHHAGIPSANLEKMRSMYGTEVAVLPEQEIANIIAAGGFQAPIHFLQAILIHGWYSTKA